MLTLWFIWKTFFYLIKYDLQGLWRSHRVIFMFDNLLLLDAFFVSNSILSKLCKNDKMKDANFSYDKVWPAALVCNKELLCKLKVKNSAPPHEFWTFNILFSSKIQTKNDKKKYLHLNLLALYSIDYKEIHNIYYFYLFTFNLKKYILIDDTVQISFILIFMG